MKRMATGTLVGAVLGVTVLVAASQEAVATVFTVGCLTQDGDEWYLTSSTEPIETEISPLTDAEKAAADAIEELGSRRYRLIGLSAFDLEPHQGHTVQVKGLLLEDTDESRINMTSIRHMAPSCPAGR